MVSLASVHAATAEILRTEARLDVIVDNAGAIFPNRAVSADGIEATLATMVVGPFALIGDLLPLLRSTPGSRVIAVTSGGMYAQGLHLEDLQWTAEPFHGTRAYARAKRAQVVLIREWARRIPPADVTFTAMHPGWADTPGLSASLPGFARADGAAPADAGGGHRHARLAGRCAGLRGDVGSALSRSTAPVVRPRPRNPRVAATIGAPVGPRRLDDRPAGPDRWRHPAEPHRSRFHDRNRSPRRQFMTTLHERIETTLPLDETFDYVADFANARNGTRAS